MAVSDETRRAYERAADELCRAFAAPAPVLSKTSEAPVIAVNGDGTLDVGYGGAVLTVRMTTACDGVEAGDTVLLTAYGQMLYATGVLSTGNPHYVMSGYVESTFVANNSTVEVEVEFDFPFPTAPAMVACLAGSSTSYKYGLLSVGLYKVNRSGFTLRFYNAGAGDREPSARWIAVG